MEFSQIMLKNTLSVAAATIAVIASVSLPAAAVPTCSPAAAAASLCTPDPEPEKVPEPTTILGLLSVGGVMAAKKMVDSYKASK